MENQLVFEYNSKKCFESVFDDRIHNEKMTFERSIYQVLVQESLKLIL